MKRFLLCIATLASILAIVRADGPDERYLQIYNMIQEADRLAASGQAGVARGKYSEADAALKALQQSSPNWNEQVVRYRLRYVQEKIGIAPAEAPRSTAPASVENPKASQPRPAGADERDAQMASLREAVQKLEGDKAVLEAKLKEALAAQPAAVDPRELAKAQEQLRSVEKEKELLRMTLDQQKAQLEKLASGTGTGSLQSDLAAANRKLAEQREATIALARETDILQKRLKEVQNDSSLPALKSENRELKRQLEARTANLPPNQRAEKAEKELASARKAIDSNEREIARLKEEKESLRTSKTDLEKRLAAMTKEASSGDRTTTDRIKRLEKERDELLGRLNEATKIAKTTKKRDALAKELTALRAKLGVFEAQKVPYSPEELALFKQPAIEPAKVAAQSAAKELPANAASLVAEAEVAFRARRYDEAEKKYQDVLKLDGRNPSALANLAASQLEQNRMEEAEATVRRALAADANDSRAMTLLGIVKFRQKKFDDALEVLSRSAEVDPKNSETQNYLGITLSQKGQRIAAETALRKAIQLSPGYGSAHHNLAVVYATQKPPFLELARWHYQKAIAAGHPRNEDVEKLLAK